MMSIPEEVGRRWLAGCSEQERGWVPRRECENWLGLMVSWLGLMHEVELLRLPLVFGRCLRAGRWRRRPPVPGFTAG